VSSKSRIIGAVEIGTSKVAVLIGEMTQGRSVHLIGFGECQSHGVIKGAVSDFKAASDAAHSALLAAEQSASVKVDEVYLAQTGGHLEGFYNQATVSVNSADNMVSQLDIDTVCRLAKAKALPEGRMVVHHIRRPFQLDGRMVGANPEHLVGQRLDVGYWTVHGQENKIADNIHVIRGFNVRVGELILSSLASGTMVTSLQDRQHGALVIDIGAGTTDYVLYRDGAPYMTGVVSVGGSHLTNDLALGLRVTEGQAEKLKLRHGRGMVAARDKAEKVWLNGDFAIGDRQFPKQAIETITAARCWELFEVVKKKLGQGFDPERCGAGVVLAGGTAKLPGITDAAGKVFGVHTTVGEMPGWVDEKLRDPRLSTVLGLLHFGLQSRTERLPARRSGSGNFIKKLFTVGS
jgi:cell division protein FtsA